MLMGDVCLTLENCGRHDLSNALSDDISRLRAALTAHEAVVKDLTEYGNEMERRWDAADDKLAKAVHAGVEWRERCAARDKAIEVAEEALKALTYDCVFPDNFADQRAKDIRSAVAALAALAAVKEAHWADLDTAKT